jgi:hypothetical protein
MDRDENNERATERHTPTEQFLLHERRQRIANLATAMALSLAGVPILREQAPAETTQQNNDFTHP